MNSTFYKISQENIETILKYYDSINVKINNYSNNILKFKEYTNEYCTKIKEIFKDSKTILNINDSSEEYETIEIDFKLNNKNVKKKKFNSGEIYEKKIKTTLLKNSIEKMDNFINELIGCMEVFTNSLDVPLTQLNNCIEITGNEISSIRYNHERQRNDFILKYNEFEQLNKELNKLYFQAEKKMVVYCLEKKKKKNRPTELEQLDNNLNASINQTVENQDTIIDKYNSLDNFGKIFNDSTKEKINNIKDFTSGLFQKFDIILKNIFIYFKKSFLPMEQLLKNKEINIENEIKNKKKFEELLDSYIQNVDEKIIKNNLKEYNINLIKNDEDKETKINDNNNNIVKKISFEIVNTNIDNKDLLNEEEIYFIVKFMYEKFKLINKSKYDLAIEGQKLELKKIIDKMTDLKKKKKSTSDSIDNNSWNFLVDETIENENIMNKEDNINNNKKDNIDEKLTINNNIQVTKEEVDYLCTFMKEKVYQNYFLIKINNFRTLGIFELPLEIFNYLVQIFSEISKNFYIIKDEEKNEIIIEQDIGRLIFILSQTFYIMKDGKKHYLQNELSKEKIFHINEFWIQMIQYSIKNEMSEVSQKTMMNKLQNPEKIQEIKNSVIFAQITPYINGMYGFGVNKEEIKNIVVPLIEEYEVPEENKEIMFGLIENQ